MQFATFRAGDQLMYGSVLNGEITLLSPHFPDWTGLKEVIAAGALSRLADMATTLSPTHSVEEAAFEIPIQNPEKIICVGVNFPDRNAEYKDGVEAPPNMSLFVRFPRSFTGHNQPLIRPSVSDKLDYEGEIAVVIGKGGRHIPQSDALDHISAMTLCNEGTLRDWVRHAKFNVTQGKNFDRSGAMGPFLTPFHRPEQLVDIVLRTKVNGEVRQEDRTSRMMFPIARQIEYISTFTTLAPGDIIVTGTPTGAGARLDPPVYLKPGDLVEVEADGLGVLVNGVEDEA